MIINMTGGGKPELQAKTVTPSTSNVVVTPDSGYDGLSQVTVNGDPELVAGNIKEGVNIFGVVGTLQPAFDLSSVQGVMGSEMAGSGNNPTWDNVTIAKYDTTMALSNFAMTVTSYRISDNSRLLYVPNSKQLAYSTSTQVYSNYSWKYNKGSSSSVVPFTPEWISNNLYDGPLIQAIKAVCPAGESITGTMTIGAVAQSAYSYIGSNWPTASIRFTATNDSISFEGGLSNTLYWTGGSDSLSAKSATFRVIALSVSID